MTPDDLTLATLSHDVIRRIARMANFSLAVRLITRTWKDLVEEDRSSRPELEEFSFIKLPGLDGWQFILRIKPKVKEYVKANLSEWQESRTKELNFQYITLPPSYSRKVKKQLEKQARISVADTSDESELSLYLSRVFSRFRSIKTLTVFDSHQRLLNIIGNSLNNEVFVEMLVLAVTSFDIKSRTFTLEQVQKFKVNQIWIMTNEVNDIHHFRDFLLQLSKVALGCPSLILQQRKYNIPDKLFRQPRAFWDDIAYEMVTEGQMKVVYMKSDNMEIHRSR